MRRKPSGSVRRRIIRWVAAALQTPEPLPFAVISRGRTGSNLLLSLLSSHPEIRIYGEIVGEFALRQPDVKQAIMDLGPVPYVARCFERAGLESAVGVKILYYQVEDAYARQWGVEGLPELMEFLKSRKTLRVIHLKRRNRLACLASIRVAALTKQYLVTNDKGSRTDNVSIRLAAEDCEKEFRRIGEWEAHYDEAFQDHEKLEVFYETLVSEWDAECNRVLDFLGVTRRTLTTSMRKQRNVPLSEVIDNYDELRRFFSGTAWACYFEE